jgi:hypothetical protein
MTTRCRCCGQPLPTLPDRLRRARHPTLAAIVEAVQIHGGAASMEQIVQHVWRDDPDGGPLQPHANVHQAVKRGEDALAALGWSLRTRRGPGAVWALEAS